MIKNIENSKKFNYDLFGIDFPIRYQSQRKASTLISKILSIISYIILLILIILYIIEIYNHKNLNVVICQKYLFENYLVDFSEIPILIGIKNNFNEIQEIDNNYYSLKIETNENIPNFKNGIRNIYNNITNIELEKCNKNLLKNQFLNQISAQDINYLYCIKPNQNLTFYGKYSDFLYGFKSIDIILLKCNNETNNNKCKSEKEINEKLHNHYLFFYYISHKVNHLNISNPIQTLLKYEQFLISQNFIKYYYYSILPSIYTTMNNFIFSRSKDYNFYEFNGIDFDFLENNDNSSNQILNVFFTSNNQINHYYRSYIQLKDLIAKMGGIIDIIFILFQVVTNYLSKKSLHIELINTLINNECKEFCRNFGTKKIDYSYTEFNNSNFIFSNKNFEFKSFTVKNKNNEKKEKNNSNNLINNNSNNNNNLSVDINNFKDNKIISNKSLKYYLEKNRIKKPSKQKLKLNLFEYILPSVYFKKNNEFDLMILFIEIFHNLLSIENIIPMIERFNSLYTNSDLFNNNILYIFNVPKDIYPISNNINNLNIHPENKEETAFEIVKTNNNLITKKINVNKPINKNNE